MTIFSSHSSFHVYISFGYSDIWNDLQGHLVIIKELMNLFAENTMFLFCGKNNSMPKYITWNNNGFWLMQKQLHIDTFVWTQTSDDLI